MHEPIQLQSLQLLTSSSECCLQHARSTGKGPANTVAIKDPVPEKPQRCSASVQSTDPRRLLPCPQVFVSPAAYQPIRVYIGGEVSVTEHD